MRSLPWFTVMVLMLAACSPVGPHTPVLTVRSDEVPVFPVTGSVSIDNVQADSAPVELGFRGIVVNLNESTQVLVDALLQELRSRGATVGAGGHKQLRVSVNHIDMVTGANVYRANIDISVTPGSADAVAIHATRASLLSGYNMQSNPTKPLDVAMSDAVMQILGDPRIQRYLGE